MPWVCLNGCRGGSCGDQHSVQILILSPNPRGSGSFEVWNALVTSMSNGDGDLRLEWFGLGPLWFHIWPWPKAFDVCGYIACFSEGWTRYTLDSAKSGPAFSNLRCVLFTMPAYAYFKNYNILKCAEREILGCTMKFWVWVWNGLRAWIFQVSLGVVEEPQLAQQTENKIKLCSYNDYKIGTMMLKA